jgi:peptidoglycan/xylan/chitin deacetylase (PgdA/CDA1 family)
MMDKHLVKLYFVILVFLVLAILLTPVILDRTSALVAEAATAAKLAAYKAGETESIAPAEEKGSVAIIMDDGFETQYTSGYKVLKRSGLKGAVAVIPAAVGEAGYMNYRQLAELYMDGWDMLNHTYNHMGLTELSKEEQALQILRGRDWLRSRQLLRGSDILVYPGGNHNELTKEALKETGTAAARSLKSVWVRELDCTPEDVEVCNIISGMPVKDIKAAIDKAANNKSAVLLVLHKIEPVTDDSKMQIEESTLQSIVDYIADNGSLNVVTLSELLQMQQ